MSPRLLWFLYNARSHRIGRWSIQAWFAGLPFLGGIAAAWLATVQPAGSRDGWWLYGVAAGLLLLAVGVVIAGRMAAQRDYVSWEPQALPGPAPNPLHPGDKIALHATGTFAVNDRRHFFARLQAYWRTFGSREHAVMAIAHESRFLLIGHTPEPDLGMWYIFVRPERVKSVEAGTLAIGSNRGPGLALRYEGEPPEGRSRRRSPPAGQHEVAYLLFATETDRNSVWGDLLAGATG